MARTLVGLFDDEAEAQQVAQELLRQGVSRDDISIVTNDTGGSQGYGMGNSQQGGQIAAEGQRSIPGVLPGGVQGGVVNALTQGGIGQSEAQHYAEAVRRGGALVTVDAEGGNTSQIESILRGRQPMDIGQRADYHRQTGFTQYDESAAPYTPEQRNTERQNLRLYAERLQANKQQVAAGEVTLRKNVVTETQTLDVPVTREEVVIERHAVNDRPATDADFRDETISVPVMEERVNVQKQAYVTEEVNVGKRQVQETQHVSDTVRREEVQVDNPGNVNVAGSDTLTNRADRDEMIDEDELDATADTTARRGTL